MLPVIYYVKPRDSLYSIAIKFNLVPSRIRKYNNLQSNSIYVGQKIYIPASFYIVQSGDSLYSIARTLNTTVESIIKLNALKSVNLYIGQSLKIPFYSEVVTNIDNVSIRVGPSISYRELQKLAVNSKMSMVGSRDNWYKVKLHNDKFGWVPKEQVNFNVYWVEKPISTILGYYTREEGPALPSSYQSFIDNKNSIPELGLFLFRIDPKEATSIEKFGEFTDEYVKNIVLIAHRSNIKVLATVHNLLYKDGGTTLAKELVNKMVSTAETRGAFIENILTLLRKYNFDGVNIDIEDVYLKDKDKLSLFYEELSRKLKEQGYYVSAALPARVSDEPFNPFSDPFDYGRIGSVLDEAVIMLYNEHGWPGSGPGPVVSIGWMERVIGYTITKMPRENVVAAVSVFGFDFNLTTGKNTYVTYNMAVDLAKKYNKDIIFDEKTQTPTFAYTDEKGEKHEVWFEDTRSIKAKIDKAYQMGIKGIALWRLGMEDKGIWNMLKNQVVVRFGS